MSQEQNKPRRWWQFWRSPEVVAPAPPEDAGKRMRDLARQLRASVRLERDGYRFRPAPMTPAQRGDLESSRRRLARRVIDGGASE